MTPTASAVSPLPATTPPDPRMTAFLEPQGLEVFHAIVHQAQIWRADPFDVPTLHAEARDAFERALNRAASEPPPEHGRILLLLGEAGSGKTHLVRAFRQLAHASGLGCLGYLQMTSQADNYAAYVLGYLIDSLEQPYDEPRVPATGLARLSQGILEALPLVTAEERVQFREGHIDFAELPRRVNTYADMAVMDSRFAACDLDLIRALLYLQRDDPRVRARVLQWLRCEDLAPVDREVLGGLVPRCREESPLRMIVQLGRLLRSVHGAALVLCVDQIEDMAAQDKADERLRKVVNSLVAVTDQLPSAVVVLTCLEDFYKANREHLPKPKLDRLERDPPPIRLSRGRSADEVEALISRRLECLYDQQGIAFDPGCATFPFTPTHLARLAGLSSREVLLFCNRHREACIAGGRWVEPQQDTSRPVQPPGPVPPEAAQVLDREWNDFHAAFKVPVPVEESELAKLLADTIPLCSAELPRDHFFEAEADGRTIQVESHGPGNAVDRFVVSVCNRPAQGNGLLKQINEATERAGEIPVVFVRSADFPASPTAVVVKRLVGLIEPKGSNRRAVVQDADWRFLRAFQDFSRARKDAPGFLDWQRDSQPLSKLASLRKILALDRLTAVRTEPTNLPTAPPSPAPPRPVTDTPPAEASTERLHLGMSRGLTPVPITIDAETLSRHTAFLGGSGSGKTTAALNIVEQLLECGVPAVLVDRKGDLCRYADPVAWAGAEGLPQRAGRRLRLRERLDVAVYTPGHPAGRPLSLPIAPPGMQTLPTAEREQIAGYAAAALGTMMAYKPKGADQSKLAVLGKAIEVLALAGGVVTLPALRRLIDERDASLLTAVDGFEDRIYSKLGEDLLTLWHRKRSLLDEDAEVLDIGALFCGRPGGAAARARLTIVSTRFLGDAATADFWVAQFLVAVGRWIGKAPQGKLQGVLLLDEADQYLPAVRQPATKAPLENLLRRARSAGIGLLLATQSPADFDYRCRDNIGTWLVGKVKEKRAVEKMRPMLAESKVDVSGKLAGQGTGEFFLLRGGEVVSFTSEPSLLKTEQLSEDRIAELAREGYARGS